MSSVKRENNSIVLSSNNIIMDIEGTTTSISFVKDVLFPYVRKHLEAYVKENWDAEDFQSIVNALRIQANEDKENKIDGVVEIPGDGEKDALAKSVIGNVLWQMDLDRKTKSLKDLQGLIMEIGYKKGEIKGHVYEDVEPNLKLWTELEKSIYIYSSGSVHAQKLLYGHSEKGDLLPYIKGHFDTTVGNKGDVESYKKIIEQISSSSSETVFFTDIPKEAKAAKEAGLLAILMSREGNAPLTDEDKTAFQVLTSFSEIEFENTSKKRKVCIQNDEKNDNKSVESCEVSLKPPKEPTNSTLTQHQDIAMEVEESSHEEKVCNVQKSDEKVSNEHLEDKKQQQNVVSENGDIDMKTTSKITEGKKIELNNEVFESQTNKNLSNGDAGPKEKVSDELKTKNNDQLDENKQLKPADLCQLPNKSLKVESTTDNNESKNPGDEKITSVNDSHPCEEKTHLKENQDIKESSQDKSSESSEKSTKDQAINESSDVTPQNGDLKHNSPNKTESCEKNISDAQKSDPKKVMEENSEKQNNEEVLKPGIDVKDNSQSKPDAPNGLNSHTQENSVIDEKKLSESSEVSTNINGSVTSMVTNTSDIDMEVDEKPCPKGSTNSDNGTSKIISPQDVTSKELEGDIDRLNEKTPPAVLKSESVKESLTTSGSLDPVVEKDVKVKEILLSEDVSETKTAESGNKQSDANKSEEPSSEPKKQTGVEKTALESDVGIEKNALESDVNDIKAKPCVKTTVDKSSLETVSKPQRVNESSSNQEQPDEVKSDDVNIQRGTESAEIASESKSVSELCKNSEIDCKPDDAISAVDTDEDLKKQAVSKISAETQNQSDNTENSAEQNDGEKADIPKQPLNTSEKAAKESSCNLDTKETVANTDKKSDVNAEEVDNVDEKEKRKMSVNGKVDDDQKPLKGNDESGLKKEINGSALCEVKKCEVPENATIAAVVEA